MTERLRTEQQLQESIKIKIPRKSNAGGFRCGAVSVDVCASTSMCGACGAEHATPSTPPSHASGRRSLAVASASGSHPPSTTAFDAADDGEFNASFKVAQRRIDATAGARNKTTDRSRDREIVTSCKVVIYRSILDLVVPPRAARRRLATFPACRRQLLCRCVC